MKAYHFLRKDMTSIYGNEPPWKIGETRSVEGGCSLCMWGYHSSPSWFDAFEYAREPIACKVDVSRPIEKSLTKQVSKTRTLLDCRDASPMLCQFACDCAMKFLVDKKITSPTLRNCLKTLRLWLKGLVDTPTKDWACVQAYRIYDTNPNEDVRSAAYILAAALGLEVPDYSDPVYVAHQVAAQFRDRSDDASQADAWLRHHFGQLMKKLFQQPEGTFKLPTWGVGYKKAPPRTEKYTFKGQLEWYTQAKHYTSVILFEKVEGSPESAPYITQEVFPRYTVWAGLKILSKEPKADSDCEGLIAKVPTVKVGEEILETTKDGEEWVSLKI